MKRISVLLIAVLLLSLTVPAYAHPGKTDANGGHYNRSTGEYHYHHGHPEHQHPGGVCPYDFKDTTGHNSGASSGGSGSGKSSGFSGSGSTTPYIQHGNSSDSNVASNRRGSSSAKTADWGIYVEVIGLLVMFGGPSAIRLLDKIKKRRYAKSSLPPPRPPTTRPDEPPPLPPEPPKKAPHRLDLADRFVVTYGSRVVTLYGLPAAHISHVGYLRDTQQLLIRFRDDNSVLLYDGVPLAVCSEFVRSSFPDQYYDILIDRHFPVQQLA